MAGPASAEIAADGAVCFRGELDIATAELVDKAVAERLTEEPSSIVVDLSATTFVDSAGVRALVRTRQQCDSRGVGFELVCAGANTRILRTLGLMGVAVTTIPEARCEPPTP